jgi:ribosome modulation factor
VSSTSLANGSLDEFSLDGRLRTVFSAPDEKIGWEQRVSWRKMNRRATGKQSTATERRETGHKMSDDEKSEKKTGAASFLARPAILIGRTLGRIRSRVGRVAGRFADPPRSAAGGSAATAGGRPAPPSKDDEFVAAWKSAWQEGYLAAERGESIATCPFAPGPSRDAWTAGHKWKDRRSRYRPAL